MNRGQKQLSRSDGDKHDFLVDRCSLLQISEEHLFPPKLTDLSSVVTLLPTENDPIILRNRDVPDHLYLIVGPDDVLKIFVAKPCEGGVKGHT